MRSQSRTVRNRRTLRQRRARRSAQTEAHSAARSELVLWGLWKFVILVNYLNFYLFPLIILIPTPNGGGNNRISDNAAAAAGAAAEADDGAGAGLGVGHFGVPGGGPVGVDGDRGGAVRSVQYAGAGAAGGDFDAEERNFHELEY